MRFFDDSDILGGLSGFASSAWDTVKESPIKTAVVVFGAAATGGIALATAPAIVAAVSAAGFGVAGGTLSNAAASSAGLAALGGDSLATGGTGMLGGTIAVTTVGATTDAVATVTAISVLNNASA